MKNNIEQYKSVLIVGSNSQLKKIKEKLIDVNEQGVGFLKVFEFYSDKSNQGSLYSSNRIRMDGPTKEIKHNDRLEIVKQKLVAKIKFLDDDIHLGGNILEMKIEIIELITFFQDLSNCIGIEIVYQEIFSLTEICNHQIQFFVRGVVDTRFLGDFEFSEKGLVVYKKYERVNLYLITAFGLNTTSRAKLIHREILARIFIWIRQDQLEHGKTYYNNIAYWRKLVNHFNQAFRSWKWKYPEVYSRLKINNTSFY